MAEFENCEPRRHVLPPRRPQWNGVVETNRSRAEFWSRSLTVADVARDLATYEFFFNYERPHASLAKTPNEYLVALAA